jgi:hypothetical protein
MPVILTTQEARIRRIAVPSHLGQKFRETFISKIPSQKVGLLEWLEVRALS